MVWQGPARLRHSHGRRTGQVAKLLELGHLNGREEAIALPRSGCHLVSPSGLVHYRCAKHRRPYGMEIVTIEVETMSHGVPRSREPAFARIAKVQMGGMVAMKGYVVVNTEVIDSEAYAEFLEKVPAAIAAGGGRYLVRTDSAEAVQGDWSKRLVIIEFDNIEAAKGFLTSSEFTALDSLRERAAKSRVAIVEEYDS